MLQESVEVFSRSNRRPPYKIAGKSILCINMAIPGSHHPLPPSYLAHLKQRQHIQATFVGKDPYPTSPIGIPFCKPSWHEQRRGNCSGKYVLSSLGVDVDSPAIEKKYRAPEELFLHLAGEGIVFLNASYHYLGKSGFPKYLYGHLVDANKTNVPLIRKSQMTFLLGKASVMVPYLEGPFPALADSLVTVIHPDVRNRGRRPTDWHEAWDVNAIKTRFGLSIRL